MLATLPLPSATANPDEAIKVYFEVCKPFYTGDILAAVEDFVNGRVPDVNKAFAPSAPQLAAHVRSLETNRAKFTALENAAKQQLLERDKDADFEAGKTPEAVAHVRELVKGFVDSLDEKKKPKTTDEIAAEKELLRRHDHFFAEQFLDTESGTPVSKYLARQLGSAYDPEDENGDMGQLGPRQTPNNLTPRDGESE